jgi:kinesin family protein 6/9
MMTSVLRDSLGGNCKTIMIATINPEGPFTEESLSTCKFSQRVSLIKNVASINEDQDPYLVIKRLKEEILNLREENSYLKSDKGEDDILSEEDVDKLRTTCRNYVDDIDTTNVFNMGPITLTKMKDVVVIMKNLVLESRCNNTNTSNNNNSKRNSKSDNDDEVVVLLKQVKDLQSSLLQRDHEISILVNMVKKGKNEGDVRQSSRGEMKESSKVQEIKNNYSEEKSIEKNVDKVINKREIGNDTRSNDNKNNFNNKNRSKEDKSESKSSIDISNNNNETQQPKVDLFNVPPPKDIAILDNIDASFQYFQDRSR